MSSRDWVGGKVGGWETYPINHSLSVHTPIGRTSAGGDVSAVRHGFYYLFFGFWIGWVGGWVGG